MSAARSARRPVPALIFLLVLAVLAVVVWVRVSGRDSAEGGGGVSCGTAPQLPALASVTVTVINANGADKLATTTRDQFVADGFASGNVGNADPVAGVATITAGPNGAASAVLVASYLPGATVTADSRQDIGVTVTLGTDFTALATPEQAQAALASAGVSATPAAPAATDTATPGASGTSAGASGAATSPSATPTCFTTPAFPTPSAFATASSS